MTEIVFVVKLQTSYQIKTILENFTGEINAANIKKFEKSLFFNTSSVVYYLSYSFVAKIFYKS